MRQHPTSQKTRRSECRLHSSVDGDHVASPAAAGQQRKSVNQFNVFSFSAVNLIYDEDAVIMS